MSSENKEITATLIFDIIGTPPEHLTETLNNITNEIDKEKGVHVLSRKISEPVLMKEGDGLYTTFAEVEVQTQDISDVALLMFKYMPANVAVVSPGNLSLSNNKLTEILSEITRRLHSYEEIVRITQFEKNILEKKLREALNKNNSKEEDSVNG